MLLHIIYLIAITAEAVTGALSAGRQRMDLFGVVTIACVTALGGGSVRDVILGHYPLGWVKHPEFLYYTIGAALFTIFVARWLHYLRTIFLILDGLGLVAFTLIGCAIARELNCPTIVVLIAGMLTGVSGGVLRDVLCNQVPLVFQKELYASVSLCTGVAYLCLLYFQVNDNTATLLCLSGGLLLRLLAIKYSWRIPTFTYDDNMH
ncbi:trimeric intracellular cation channel family protein [Entomomonas asaccharolytica]|uniref:Trimeric intracellular cation channel family protein n=1 Tax=Entomomonas asaccharolytica TaxID=2785331 RepID=A0A974NDA8_9GAMM|nr:trimeric intracellular cation channel family protein [Entomomonas asaccharolytica]QQP84317.1 trimeric intracellular cation channel family protein [Entomomonas asaccharolytica]